ncbi:Protein of unknown function [Pyronema omphalodes CBS 100304]|uniref:Uncharacterized protein n=1 Tax=Pyronema omphalodes (strain CBS 100304) TaxID=1076935 RepID=U4LS52_PYROM|nr:Protein of unknown function [Pyronema omphalodes CBS 100304]
MHRRGNIACVIFPSCRETNLNSSRPGSVCTVATEPFSLTGTCGASLVLLSRERQEATVDIFQPLGPINTVSRP